MTGVSRDLKELRAFNDPGSAVQRFTLNRVRETLTLRRESSIRKRQCLTGGGPWHRPLWRMRRPSSRAKHVLVQATNSTPSRERTQYCCINSGHQAASARSVAGTDMMAAMPASIAALSAVI